MKRQQQSIERQMEEVLTNLLILLILILILLFYLKKVIPSSMRARSTIKTSNNIYGASLSKPAYNYPNSNTFGSNTYGSNTYGSNTYGSSNYGNSSSQIKKSDYIPPINSKYDRQSDKYEKGGLYKREEDYRKKYLGYSQKPTYSTTNNNENEYKSKPSYLKLLQQQKQTVIKLPKRELESTFKTKTLGLVGLSNIGNTCFMNSTLQCMLNLPSFNDYFLNRQYQNQLNSSGRVATAYAKLLTLIRSSSSRSETPSELKSVVAAKRHRFAGTAQQDAQEFLAALLQLMSQDLNRSKKPKYKELTADLSKESLDQISSNWWNYNKEREDSVVTDFFAGQLLSRVICSKCKHESIAFDNTWDVALNFSRDDNGNLLKMIQNFLKEETISKDYYCSKCKSLRECKRRFEFYRLPQILVIELKRFSCGKYSKQKLNNRVRVPLEMDLSPLITQSKQHSVNNANYGLVGVVNHSGDINFGHYTAECRNPLNGKWYNFNDSHVSETRVGDAIESSSPYLLFFSKVQ